MMTFRRTGSTSLLLAICVGLSASGYSAAFCPPYLQQQPQQRHYNNVCGSRLYAQTQSPEPLATEGEWTAYLDEETTGLVYYFNAKSGESRWEPPTKTFPDVYLKPSKRRVAQAKRDEYQKAMKQTQTEDSKKGFLSFLLDDDKVVEEETAPVVEEVEEEEPGFFKSIFGDANNKNEEQTVSRNVKKEVQTEEESTGFFNKLFTTQPDTTQQQGSATSTPNNGKQDVKDTGNWFGGFLSPNGSSDTTEVTVEDLDLDELDINEKAQIAREIAAEKRAEANKVASAARRAEAARKAAQRKADKARQIAEEKRMEIQQQLQDIIDASTARTMSPEEEEKVEQARRALKDLKAESARKAAEARRLEEEQKREIERKKAEAKKAKEEARAAAEARRVKEQELREARSRMLAAEKARKEEERRIAKAQQEEEAMRQEAARQAEEERLAAQERARYLAETKLAAQARAAEEARLAREAKAAEAARIKEEARLAKEAKLEEARLAKEARLAEQASIAAERARIAEEARLEKEMIAAERARIAEEARLAGEAAAAAEEEAIEVFEEDTPIKVTLGSHVLPHPAKILWGGEDAVFTKGRTFGVFDGVSGASKTDGRPLYSRTLAQEFTRQAGADGLSVQDMIKILSDASDVADERATGASTACVASITNNGFLSAINLGDSCCYLIRNGKVSKKTTRISHYFDCPYQLSVDSPDRATDSTKLNIELIRGDIVMMASDGIFDNLQDKEILDCVTETTSKMKNNKNRGAVSKTIAKNLSDQARKVSQMKSPATPYAKQAQKNRDPLYKDGVGGKVDDISCVVVLYD